MKIHPPFALSPLLQGLVENLSLARLQVRGFGCWLLFVLSFIAVCRAADTEVIKDNSDGSGVVIGGSWTSNASSGYGGSYLHDGAADKGHKSVRFTPTIPSAGVYRVYARWIANANRAANVPIDIVHAGGTATVTVNQQQNNDTWVLLGTYHFNAGTGGYVLVRTTGTSTGTYVVADAVRLVSGMVMDNADSSGITLTGSWQTSTSRPGYYGSNYIHDSNTGQGTKSVRFTPTIPAAGTYQVFLWQPAGSDLWASNAPIDIIHATGTDSVAIDQKLNGVHWGSQWVPLGTYYFNTGTGGSVLIRNAGANGYVVADAVKFVSGDAEPTANFVVRDGFTDQGRTNGAESADAAWYTIGAAGSALTVVNDNGGLEAGSALQLAPTSSGQGFVGNLPAISLGDGESLILNFKWRFAGTTNINQALRLCFGLFNSGGTQTANDNNTGVRSNDKGYWAGTNPGAASGTGTALRQENTGDELFTGSGLTSIGVSGDSINGGTTPHTAMLKITRSGSSLVVSASIDEQAPATATVSSPLTTTFDEAAISLGTGTTPSPLIVDDVRVEWTGLPQGNWTLWLNEEFDGTALNPEIWSTGQRWAEVINDELQAHRPENVTVANGICSIKIEKKPGSKMQAMGGYEWGSFNYASGAIQTFNKWSHTYGYFEARMRVPNAIGTWPGFWMMPDRGPNAENNEGKRVAVGTTYQGATFPMGNEFEVIEFFSAWKSGRFFASHAGYFWSYVDGNSWGNYALTNDGAGPEKLYYPNADTEFHTYGMYWAPGTLTFYIDGTPVLYRSYSNISVVPEYLIFNIALHTNVWQRLATIAEIDAALATPKYMDIDYVKVWIDNTLPPQDETIMDDTSGSGTTVLPNGTAWAKNQTSPSGYFYKGYWHDQGTGKGTKSFRFTPNISTSGTYEVHAWWPANASSNANNTPIDIVHTGGTSTVTVDQTTNGGQWRLLGTYNFARGTGGSVLFRTDGTAANKRVIVDAVRFLRVAGATQVTMDSEDSSGITLSGSWTPSAGVTGYLGTNFLHDGNSGKGSKSVIYTPQLGAAGNYLVEMRWTAHYNRATNVPVDIVLSNGTTTTVTVNQTLNNGLWIPLGTVALSPGNASVTVRTTGTNGYVVADGVRFTPQ